MDAISNRTAQPTVMVVEDNTSLLELLRRTLDRAGFRVIVAGNGQEAMSRFLENRIDIVVTDAIMPELDGFELIRILTKMSPGLPIAAISGIGDVKKFEEQAIQSGAKAVLSKPVNRAELVAVADRLMRSIPARHHPA